MIERLGVILPFSCEQVFDIAADVERYPEFLQWWISAHIRRREGDVCFVDQIVGAGPLRLQFTSQAVMKRPRRIDVTSSDPPFRHYALSWVVAPLPSGCRISVAADFELRSRMLQRLVGGFLPGAMDDIVTAFDARAHALCAPATGVGDAHVR